MVKRDQTGVLVLLIWVLLQACVLPGMDNNATPATPTPEETVLQASPTQEMHAAPEATSPPVNTPIPVVINPSNAALLQIVAQAELNNPSRLKWISDSELIGVMDNENLNFLNANTLLSESSAVMQPPIILLDFSSDGQTMLTTTDRVMLQVRGVSDGQIIHNWEPSDPFQQAVYSPDGNVVAVNSITEIAVELRSVANGALLNTLRGFETAAPVYHVEFSSDGQTIIWIARGSVQVMDIASGELGPFFGHQDFVNAVAMSPGGDILATAAAGMVADDYLPFIVLWDAKSGEELGKLLTEPIIATGLAFSPDGTLLAAGVDTVLVIWDVQTQNRLVELSIQSGGFSAIAFSPDGLTIAAASYEGGIYLWRVQPQ